MICVNVRAIVYLCACRCMTHTIGRVRRTQACTRGSYGARAYVNAQHTHNEPRDACTNLDNYSCAAPRREKRLSRRVRLIRERLPERHEDVAENHQEGEREKDSGLGPDASGSIGEVSASHRRLHRFGLGVVSRAISMAQLRTGVSVPDALRSRARWSVVMYGARAEITGK